MYEEGLAKLEARTRAVAILVWLVVVAAALAGVGQVLELQGTLDFVAGTGPLIDAFALVYVAYSVLFIASVVAVCMWIHRAHANLHEAGVDGLEYTPGWAVGWFFIPIANLFKPYQAMRELWNASHGAHDSFDPSAPGLLKLWWAAWLIGNICENISTRIYLMSENPDMFVANAFGVTGSVLTIVAALLLLAIVRGVYRAQRAGNAASTVFA